MTNDIDIDKDIKHLVLSVVNNNNVKKKLNELKGTHTVSKKIEIRPGTKE